jgi:hypothetical protein
MILSNIERSLRTGRFVAVRAEVMNRTWRKRRKWRKRRVERLRHLNQ